MKHIPAGLTDVSILKECSKVGTAQEIVQSSGEESVATAVCWTAITLLVRGTVKRISHGLNRCRRSDDTPSNAESYQPSGVNFLPGQDTVTHVIPLA